MAKCRMVLAFTVILVGICLCSCKIEKISSEIPQEVKKVIDEKKGSEFKLAYTDPEYTYILIGYGKQDYQGYSIILKKLYETTNSIYVQTKFKGPKEYSNIQSETFPYIVIKIESTNKNILLTRLAWSDTMPVPASRLFYEA